MKSEVLMLEVRAERIAGSIRGSFYLGHHHVFSIDINEAVDEQEGLDIMRIIVANRLQILYDSLDRR